MFTPSLHLRLYHGKVASPVNRCFKQRKKSVTETRSEPWTASPHCVSGRLTVWDRQDAYIHKSTR